MKDRYYERSSIRSPLVKWAMWLDLPYLGRRDVERAFRSVEEPFSAVGQMQS